MCEICVGSQRFDEKGISKMRVCEKDVDQAEIDLVPWHHIHHSGPRLLGAFCLLLYVERGHQ